MSCKTKIIMASLLACLMMPSYGGNAWEKVKAPIKKSKVESIGGYTNGCVLGANKLPLKGTGYQVIRSQRNRYYGHPDLVSFVQRLGNNVSAQKLPTLLIADMGMAAGGPFTKGHRSHQTGLDVDIWLRPGPSKLNTPKAMNVVDKKNFFTNQNWTKNHERIIKMAAEDARVQRIFVNAAIKRKLCKSKGNKAWLRKVRPWGGHNYHFHVRLKCPKGSLKCKNQSAVKWGSGCGREVMKWDWRNWKKPTKPIKKKKKKYRPKPILPSACRAAL